MQPGTTALVLLLFLMIFSDHLRADENVRISGCPESGREIQAAIHRAKVTYHDVDSAAVAQNLD